MLAVILISDFSFLFFFFLSTRSEHFTNKNSLTLGPTNLLWIKQFLQLFSTSCQPYRPVISKWPSIAKKSVTKKQKEGSCQQDVAMSICPCPNCGTRNSHWWSRSCAVPLWISHGSVLVPLLQTALVWGFLSGSRHPDDRLVEECQMTASSWKETPTDGSWIEESGRLAHRFLGTCELRKIILSMHCNTYWYNI